jgi:hypothetical protein
MLEWLLIAGAVAAAAPQPAASPPAPPPAELIEFIGEWTDEEAARFLDREAKPSKVSREEREPTEKKK